MALPLDPHPAETLPIRLHGVLHSQGRRFLVGVVSLSEHGFACTGASLDALGAQVGLTLALGSPAWSARAGASRGAPQAPEMFEARAEVTTVTPSRGESTCQVLAARFIDLTETDRGRLRAFLASHVLPPASVAQPQPPQPVLPTSRPGS
jgi:hypothetical protein